MTIAGQIMGSSLFLKYPLKNPSFSQAVLIPLSPSDCPCPCKQQDEQQGIINILQPVHNLPSGSDILWWDFIIPDNVTVQWSTRPLNSNRITLFNSRSLKGYHKPNISEQKKETGNPVPFSRATRIRTLK